MFACGLLSLTNLPCPLPALPACSQHPGAAQPFRPVKANGVDLFPHTSHVELVVLFERGNALKRTLAAQPPAPGDV